MEKKIYKVLNTIRGDIGIEKIKDILISCCVIGYSQSKIPDNDNYIKRILRASDTKEEFKNVLGLIEKENEQLKDVFSCLNLESNIQNDVLYKLLSNINEIEIEQNQWKDVFEIVINQINESNLRFTSESSTPVYLNKLGIDLLEPKEGNFYDGTCGEGGTLQEANSYAVSKGMDLKLYGQEINSRAGAICKIRLFLNDVINSDIKLGNTLTNPMFTEENQLMKFDRILMNPPLGYCWKEDSSRIENDKYNRFVFGKPQVSNGDWLFISHIIKSLNEDGKAVVTTTSGALFRGAKEEEIRKNILNIDCVEAVISLAGVLTSTAIPINLLVINMKKDELMKNKILFINAEDMYKKNKNQKILTEQHINKIVDIYRNKKEIEEISAILDIKNLENANLLPNKNVLKTEFTNAEIGKIKFNKNKLEELRKCKTLNDIGKFYRGINVIGSKVEECETGEYKIINLSDVKNGEIDVDSLTRYNLKDNARVESYSVKEGDILISNRGVTTKIGIVPKCDKKILISQNFIGFRLKGKDNSNYIKRYLESPLGEYLISNKQSGTATAALNIKDLEDIPVMLVKEDEQREIIEVYENEKKEIELKIEELNKKLIDIKLNLYKDMEVLDTFEVL